MKLFILTTVLLLSNGLLALTPQIGQSITYSHTFSIMGMEFAGVVKKTIIDYNADSNEYLLATSSIYEKYSSENEIWIHQISIARTYLNNTESFCSSIDVDTPHRLEDVLVKAGKFKTCFVNRTFDYNTEYKVWYSDKVPFGIVTQYDIDPLGDYNKQSLLDYSPK